MHSKAQSCYIRSDDPSFKTVYLPDCTPVFVGRCIETNITDTTVSRKQVRLYANYEEYKVFIEQTGDKCCGFNGFQTSQGVQFIAKHNDRLEILYGKYLYNIEFNPPPEILDDKENNTSLKKRSLAEEDSESQDNANPCKIPKMDGTDTGLKDESNHSGNTELGEWESYDNNQLLIYFPPKLEHRTKIAAYDMDKTLIKTKSGLEFPKNCEDWQLLYPDVPGKLKKIYADGYKIVIFTNQAHLGTVKVTIPDFKVKIERVIKKLGVPIQAFIACGRTKYRKPCIGMWETLVNHKNGGLPVNKDDSFYVGDAAGRPKDWAPKKKKDHSMADRLLALNLGLTFFTPEEHFLGKKSVPFTKPAFNPTTLPQHDEICSPKGTRLASKDQEVILMTGCPGSGKSHFTNNYLTEYKRVNRDSLGSWQKCVSMMEKFLNEGKSVVIDNTNPDPATRQRYIEIAKKCNIPVRCFVMRTNVEHAKHNNKFRELCDSTHAKINDIIINSYVKNYIAPSLDEGFSEIVYINFIPKFTSNQDQNLYEMYLLEN